MTEGCIRNGFKDTVCIAVIRIWDASNKFCSIRECLNSHLTCRISRRFHILVANLFNIRKFQPKCSFRPGLPPDSVVKCGYCRLRRYRIVICRNGHRISKLRSNVFRRRQHPSLWTKILISVPSVSAVSSTTTACSYRIAGRIINIIPGVRLVKIYPVDVRPIA